jgi:hypothetical protein
MMHPNIPVLRFPHELTARCSVSHQVLLTSEAELAAWLNPEIVERGPLEALMRPLGDGVLEVRRVNE